MVLRQRRQREVRSRDVAERNKLWRSARGLPARHALLPRTDEPWPTTSAPRSPSGGLPRDEFKDTNGWPFQLYVRECRRLVGQYVMSRSDCEHPPATLADSVGLGVYRSTPTSASAS